AFAVFYMSLGQRFLAGGGNCSLGRMQAVYFSFTTLLTVGYGDITPIGSFSQSVVVVEMLSGLAMVAILLAVVGGWSYAPPPSRQLLGDPLNVSVQRLHWLGQTEQ